MDPFTIKDNYRVICSAVSKKEKKKQKKTLSAKVKNSTVYANKRINPHVHEAFRVHTYAGCRDKGLRLRLAQIERMRRH